MVDGERKRRREREIMNSKRERNEEDEKNE